MKTTLNFPIVKLLSDPLNSSESYDITLNNIDYTTEFVANYVDKYTGHFNFLNENTINFELTKIKSEYNFIHSQEEHIKFSAIFFEEKKIINHVNNCSLIRTIAVVKFEKSPFDFLKIDIEQNDNDSDSSDGILVRNGYPFIFYVKNIEICQDMNILKHTNRRNAFLNIYKLNDFHYHNVNCVAKYVFPKKFAKYIQHEIDDIFIKKYSDELEKNITAGPIMFSTLLGINNSKILIFLSETGTVLLCDENGVEYYVYRNSFFSVEQYGHCSFNNTADETTILKLVNWSSICVTVGKLKIIVTNVLKFIEEKIELIN